MTRPLQHWDLALALSEREPSQPLFVRIARAIGDDIRRGRLAPGVRLPGTREIARGVGAHRNTVLAAFRELHAEGFLETQAGRGTFVARAVPEQRPRRFGPRPERGKRLRAGFDLPAARLPEPSYAPLPSGTLALYGGLPDLRLVPSAALGRAYRRALRRPDVLGYGDPRGLGRLREALAIMLRASRGLDLDAGQIVVTRGSQMALALAAKAALEPGAAVAVEVFGYRPAWAALRAAGVRLVPMPVDADGLRVDALAAACERERIHAVYLTPHHQYPTTAVLSAPRRLALLELCAKHRIAIIEDDYDHEFHYEGRPILPLASADRNGNVIYIGTLSKVLAPGLRIGYVVGPGELLERITAQRFYLDRQGDQATESAVAELLEDGELQRHVRRTRRIYERRRAAFVAALEAGFGDRLRFRRPQGILRSPTQPTPRAQDAPDLRTAAGGVRGGARGELRRSAALSQAPGRHGDLDRDRAAGFGRGLARARATAGRAVPPRAALPLQRSPPAVRALWFRMPR